jgi:phosphate transport system substrate-binding protein
MRRRERITGLAACLLLCGLFTAPSCTGSKDEKAPAGGLEGTITISGAWALYPMAVRWAEEFERLHPHVRIDVAAGGAGKGMADALARIVDLGAVSRGIYTVEIEKGAWYVSVVKDAVVPTVNARNPVITELLVSGASREVLARIWLEESASSWGGLVRKNGGPPVRVYTRSDACGAAQTWALYLGGEQDDLLGVGVYGDPGVAAALSTDELGIGYNNMNFAYDPETERQVEGIRVLPIDLDGNGRIDPEEDFYETRGELVEAIADGRYPSPPARDLHFVSHGRPERAVVLEFLEWVLKDGQAYVHEAGYIPLGEERLAAERGKLGDRGARHDGRTGGRLKGAAR